MKLFLLNFSRSISIDTAKALKDKGMEIIYWTGGKAEFDKFSQETKDFPGTIFHNYFDALQGKPALKMDLSQFKPVGQEVIDKLSKYETQLLVMMSRIDFENITIEAKRHIYHQYVDYWYNVLTILKPDVLIFSDIPHSIFNTIIYNIAKLLDIRTIMTRRVNGLLERVTVFEDFYKYQEIKDDYQDLQNKSFRLEDLSKDLQQYYIDQSKSGANLTTFFQRFMVKKAKDAEALPRFTAIIKNIKNATFIKTTKSYFKMMFGEKRYTVLEEQYYSGWAIKKKELKLSKIRKKFKQEYLDLQSPADFSDKFIYLPLHFQPECSTSPMGGVFDDQILMINILSAALPQDWFIYVKEHSIQWKGSRAHVGRYTGYYQQIAKLKNVKLISTETSPNELIERSQAIATITGTVGWEGLMKLKPVIVFGYIWYMHCNGVFQVNDFDSCQKALVKIADGFHPDSEDIIKYLKVVDKNSLRGYLKARYSDESNISYEDNIKNITEILYNKLTKK